MRQHPARRLRGGGAWRVGVPEQATPRHVRPRACRVGSPGARQLAAAAGGRGARGLRGGARLMAATTATAVAAGTESAEGSAGPTAALELWLSE